VQPSPGGRGGGPQGPDFLGWGGWAPPKGGGHLRVGGEFFSTFFGFGGRGGGKANGGGFRLGWPVGLWAFFSVSVAQKHKNRRGGPGRGSEPIMERGGPGKIRAPVSGPRETAPDHGGQESGLILGGHRALGGDGRGGGPGGGTPGTGSGQQGVRVWGIRKRCLLVGGYPFRWKGNSHPASSRGKGGRATG